VVSAERRWRAMGSDIHVIVVSDASSVGGGVSVDQLLAWAEARIAGLEQCWSRFRPDSEVSRLNAAAGGDALFVSNDTVLLIEQAKLAWSVTGGMFDPTLLDALCAAGYDRTFDELDPSQPEQPVPVLRFDRPDCNDIFIERDDDGAMVAFPEGLGFDPGGIGKGLSADLVTHDLLSMGAAGVCVNMGGDLRVAGVDPHGNAWTIGVDHPRSSTPLALVGLSGGAVATSTVLKRTWSIAGASRHHLLDPHTLEPSDSDVALATVIAGTAWEAEVLAKAALLRGVRRAFDLLERDMAGLVVDHEGNVFVSDTFDSFTGGIAVASPVVVDR
jgi:thiamine biosynthesis lipoprotein